MGAAAGMGREYGLGGRTAECGSMCTGYMGGCRGISYSLSALPSPMGPRSSPGMGSLLGTPSPHIPAWDEPRSRLKLSLQLTSWHQTARGWFAFALRRGPLAAGWRGGMQRYLLTPKWGLVSQKLETGGRVPLPAGEGRPNVSTE